MQHVQGRGGQEGEEVVEYWRTKPEATGYNALTNPDRERQVCRGFGLYGAHEAARVRARMPGLRQSSHGNTRLQDLGSRTVHRPRQPETALSLV